MPEISGNQLASLTGMTWRTIKKRLDTARVKPMRRERNADLYESSDALPAIYGHAGKESQSALDAARTRHADEQADRIKMENAVRRRELAPTSVITLALARVSSQVAATLEAIPGRLRLRLPHLAVADLAAIHAEIVAARNIAAKVNIDKANIVGPKRTAKSRRGRA